MTAFFAAFRRDVPLYLAIFAYTVTCGLLSVATGAAGKFLPFMYISRWLILLVLLSVIYLVFMGAKASRCADPLRQFKEELREKMPWFAAGACLCLALSVLHGTYTSTKSIAPDLLPFRYDVLLADLDHALHGADPWTLLTWLNPLTDAIQPLYSVVWILMLVLVTTFAVTSAPVKTLKAQYSWSFFLCWVVLGNLLSSMTLAAGPAFYARVVGSDRFAGLTAHLVQHDGSLSAHRLQNLLWNAYSDSSAGFASGISAFPSMHLSMVTLFTLYGFRINIWVGAAFLTYAFVILLASVHLGWHYAIDGYFSIMATFLLWKLVAWGLAGFPRSHAEPRKAIAC